MNGDRYLIWSNEHRAWWARGGWGYSPGLTNAGRYSREEALRLCRDAICTADHIGIISEIPVRLCDVEEFLKDTLPRNIILFGER